MPQKKSTLSIYDRSALDSSILCKYCFRKFNKKAADRHITHCKEKTEKKQRDLKNEERQFKL
jgi:hypothetical protein